MDIQSLKPDEIAKLRVLIDHFEIREVIEAYVDACDRCDRDALADTYHADSFDHHGPMAAPGHEFATACVDALLKYYRTCTHILGQSRIKVDGDRAGAETYYFASETQLVHDKEIVHQQIGRYIDVFERREGVWRVKDRRCIQEWSSSFPMTVDHATMDLFIKGIRSEKDPSYEVLGLKKGRTRIIRK